MTGEMPRISSCACGVPCSPHSPFPFDESIDMGSGPASSGYHCSDLFSFAEADNFQHARRKRTPGGEQNPADTYFTN